MRHILGNLFIAEVFISDAGLLTVTNVKVTDDLKLAKVYLSFLENKKPVNEILMILRSKNNIIRRSLGKKLSIKYIPQLQYYYDDSIEHAHNIDKLIKKIHKND